MLPRKPLPVAVTKAVAAAAAARRGQPKVGAFAPVALPPGEAKALVDKTCGTGCHSVEVVTSQRMKPADWETVVRAMVNRGAQATDTEVRAIVDYLAKNLGKSPRLPPNLDVLYQLHPPHLRRMNFDVGSFDPLPVVAEEPADEGRLPRAVAERLECHPDFHLSGRPSA